jgi:hypothetical protein
MTVQVPGALSATTDSAAIEFKRQLKRGVMHWSRRLTRLRRPNNRLQGMRGLACFRAEERLARRPRTPDPCVVRPLGKQLR